MDIIYILVPLSIVLISIATLIFFWAVRSGQFDDMESPAHRILFDDDDDPASTHPTATDTTPAPHTTATDKNPL
ncbi:cbb3-type cytochrome oxidase assembly protein CcoS [Oceanobacter sp. 5_MG-2023]|uniref:cbb3-type cytochrome oxidase assembly protein CcoS n=1 Tax=Oceanobacter sp. 5_MG-2023 TaxID=3062645 RepID=UPI0026E237F8|nr:cbb3-type cytochrome oxidase assembly protein CcoS [Oceanobacter sp. 5_MG-2023]MDO6683229.1 cbb3-type cytochrome oxidase assembly protein CcoS [Oceanobacter sp. 5_MG-2023]